MATATATAAGKLEELLGADAADLLQHRCETIPKEMLHLPGPDFVDRVWAQSDRPTRVLRSLQQLYGHGRLGGTGYLSILPVDQGIEHSAGASFAPNPEYFDGGKLVELAVEGECNAVASTFGVLGSVARRYAHRIPFILKFNHNELLTYPNKFDQIMFGTIKEAWNLGAGAVGATVYFGAEEADRQIQEVSAAFAHAHELGMATVLWCYLRNNAFKKDGTDYHLAADLTGQANHLGVSIQADIIIPVPLHSERHKQRGYNHAALLAAVCAAKTGIPFYDNLVLRHRATLAQVGLNPSERQQNVQGAFTCSPAFAPGQLHGRTILLIDDVCTTGATLEACAAPLFSAGARTVWGLVLARPSN